MSYESHVSKKWKTEWRLTITRETTREALFFCLSYAARTTFWKPEIRKPTHILFSQKIQWMNVQVNNNDQSTTIKVNMKLQAKQIHNRKKTESMMNSQTTMATPTIQNIQQQQNH